MTQGKADLGDIINDLSNSRSTEPSHLQGPVIKVGRLQGWSLAWAGAQVVSAILTIIFPENLG